MILSCEKMRVRKETIWCDCDKSQRNCQFALKIRAEYLSNAKKGRQLLT